ncbi:hypothetical protein [Streptomyces sp. NPDC016626]|uniref:hypothetical protein n=1 Tax=Streptomyces sp. NPDC016626 TaxID=3364968 RepID=UPI003700C370
MTRQELIGSWVAGGGGTAQLAPDGTLTLAGVSCEVVSPGTGDVPLEAEGTWRLQPQLPGESSLWVRLGLPAGTCDNSGELESGLHPYRHSGELKLSLHGPDATDQSLLFTKRL